MEIPIEPLLQCLLALGLGLVLGFERELRTKPAGLRTLMLVSLGSCVFTLLSVELGSPESHDRIAANIVTGIGFLGAGSIFRDENRVSGLTTAALIWYAAAIGMMVGSGKIYLAILLTGIALLIMLVIFPLETLLEEKHLNKVYAVGVRSGKFEDLAAFEALFSDMGLKHNLHGVSRKEKKLVARWNITGSKKKHAALAYKLLDDERVEWLEY